MTSAPWERESAKIAHLYKQLDWQDQRETSPAVSTSSVEEELFGEDFDGPDPSNPFDYRHYLNGLPSASPASHSASRAPTPQRSTPSIAAATVPARLSNGSSNTAGKRNVAPLPKPPLHKPTTVPTIHMQRRASVKNPQPLESDADDDDDNDNGGLIIEADPDEPPAKRRHLGFTRSPGGGPISLRSAANSTSPASRPIASPAASSVQGCREAGSGSEEDGEDGDEADDGDVDDFELGSPAVGQAAAAAAAAEDDDEEDHDDYDRRQSLDPREQAELQATLEQAFGEASYEDARAEEARQRMKAQESESESEEE